MKKIYITLLLLLSFNIISAQHFENIYYQNNNYYIKHLVTKGETLFQISRDYFLTPTLLCSFNKLNYQSKLTVNQLVNIPIISSNYIGNDQYSITDKVIALNFNNVHGESTKAISTKLKEHNIFLYENNKDDNESKTMLNVGYIKCNNLKGRIINKNNLAKKKIEIIEDKKTIKELSNQTIVKKENPVEIISNTDKLNNEEKKNQYSTSSFDKVANFKPLKVKRNNNLVLLDKKYNINFKEAFTDLIAPKKLIAQKLIAIINQKENVNDKITLQKPTKKKYIDKQVEIKPDNASANKKTFSSLWNSLVNGKKYVPEKDYNAKNKNIVNNKTIKSAVTNEPSILLNSESKKNNLNLKTEEVIVTTSISNIPVEVKPIIAETKVDEPIIKSDFKPLSLTQTKSGLAAYFFAGESSGKFYVVTNLASKGSIIKITNSANGKHLFAEVLDELPHNDIRQGLLVKLSDNAKLPLAQKNNSFTVKVNY